MSEEKTVDQANHFQLPNQLAGGIELTRLLRELENLDDFLYQAQIRTPGTAMSLPRTSKILHEIAELNHYSLLEQTHRTQLIEALKNIEDNAPGVHISFAVEPSAIFVDKLVTWMRKNIHQYVLVEIGLQPTIAVGCVVRTSNKIFDMSLRHKFSEIKHVLIEKLAEVDKAPAPEKPQEQPV